MGLKQGLHLKQTQGLVMTPQLQQAIKILTLTHQEMTDLIAQEMVENPMLEEIGGETVQETKDTEYKIENLEGDVKEATSENFTSSESMTPVKDDFDWANYAESFSGNQNQPPNMAKQDFDELPNYENILSGGMNLQDHLEWQLRMNYLTKDEWNLAEFIIHNLNDEGYLDLTDEQIAEKSKLDPEDTLEILHMIQGLDPVGCACRDLKECLMAQALSLSPRSPLVEKIISHHLDELQKNDLMSLVHRGDFLEDDLKEALLLIQHFHPKPGRVISPEEVQYIVPDIFVVEMGGEFVVQLNDEGVPRLRISKLYQSMLKDHTNKEAQDYVKDKLRAASFLIKSIHNRQSTIIKVAKAILEKQQDFFKRGPRFLRPMILKDIAQEIGMHESTVSRVTTNKYMHTPIGLFELRYFFNAGIGGKEGGHDIAGEVLKIKMKDLIEKENPKRPLSDQKIAEILGREGVTVARRTVAKYREGMGIASSAERKKK